MEKYFDGLTISNADIESELVKYSSIVSELSEIISVSEDYDYKKRLVRAFKRKI